MRAVLGSSDLPLTEDAYNPKYDLLASRTVINEMQARGRYLQLESSNLYRDAGDLWSAWKNLFGIRGGVFDTGGFLRPSMELNSPAGAALGAGFETRLQADVFALRSAGERADEAGRAAMDALAASEREWWRLSRLMYDAQGLPAERAALRAGFAELRADLGRDADRLNLLDDKVTAGQETLNSLYPRIEEIAATRMPGAWSVPKPWHWRTYMLSDARRPSVRYDLETRYRQELENARAKPAGAR
jgi:hypothetical protein